jgi:hypothetical protein
MMTTTRMTRMMMRMRTMTRMKHNVARASTTAHSQLVVAACALHRPLR